MFCNIGLHTDATIGKSAIKFKDIKKLDIKDSPIAICDNGNMSQIIKSLNLNKCNIPAVELNIIKSYEEKRAPGNPARFFAFDELAYKSICRMIEIANRHKHYSPRITLNDLILDGDLIIIVDAGFLFINELPEKPLYVALNANSNLSDKVYLKHKPIFYYDSYAIDKDDVKKIAIISARKFTHEGRVWYHDPDHYTTAKFLPESIENYQKLLAKANHPIVEFKNRYPRFCENSEIFFDSLVDAGFHKRYPNATQEQKDRLEYERSVIKKMGYCDYFLINWDFINWSRFNDIPIGPGRGSAAGSIIAYCLDITKLDPLANGLYFERFLNPERVSPPDIDTDINTEDRANVIEYIKNKYGKERVSQIITFSELKSKSALKDAARNYNVDAFEINKITSYFPPAKFGITPSLDEAYEVELVKEWAQNHRDIWNEAKALEGFIRQTGIHAAGIIISPEPMNEMAGISYAENEAVCQLDKNDSEKFGLLKMDFLGLTTLGIIKNIQKLRGMSYYDMEKIPLDDKQTLEAFAKGDTHGVFQFESDGMRKLLIRIAPTCFGDIAAATALYRPGPLMSGLVEEYIHNKNSIDPVYFLPEFKELMAETYGVFVYQEQVMLISQKIAGFTLSRADNLRKAIGKKDRKIMATMEDEFKFGCVANGFDPVKSKKLWDQIVKFADYCFNKSHSYAYTMISYWAMYLKTHHPKEFAVSLLSYDMKDSSKLRGNFYSFKDKIKFLPPYINDAKENFVIGEDGVYMGFGSLKGLGSCASTIPANQPYSEVIDVVLKNKMDSSQLKTLIYSGAFDKMEPNRGILLGNLDRILNYRKQNSGSAIYNIFDPVDMFQLDRRRDTRTPLDSFMEKDCYGFNIYHGFLGKSTWLITSLPDNTIIGNVAEIKRTKTKKDSKDMAILTVETLTNKIKVVLFSEMYSKFNTQLVKEEVYAFKGELKYRNTDDGEEEASLIVSDLLTEPMIVPVIAECYTNTKISKEDFNKEFNKIEKKKGMCQITVYERLFDEDYRKLFDVNDEIHYTEEIHRKLEEMGFRIKLNIF